MQVNARIGISRGGGRVRVVVEYNDLRQSILFQSAAEMREFVKTYSYSDKPTLEELVAAYIVEEVKTNSTLSDTPMTNVTYTAQLVKNV